MVIAKILRFRALNVMPFAKLSFHLVDLLLHLRAAVAFEYHSVLPFVGHQLAEGSSDLDKVHMVASSLSGS
jgi:hypothetical protein